MKKFRIAEGSKKTVVGLTVTSYDEAPEIGEKIFLYDKYTEGFYTVDSILHVKKIDDYVDEVYVEISETE